MKSLNIIKGLKQFFFPPPKVMLGRWRSTIINDNSQKQWFLFTSTQDNCYLNMYNVMTNKNKKLK